MKESKTFPLDFGIKTEETSGGKKTKVNVKLKVKALRLKTKRKEKVVLP